MMSVRDAFATLRSALETAGIRFAVGGSWASAAFGEPRFTNDVDILADFTPDNLDCFLSHLPRDFVFAKEEARSAVRLGRPFNIIYIPVIFKFDFFSARAFPLGLQELDRAVPLSAPEICDEAVPFVTPEDILLAKLHWFREGGEASTVQWRDIRGILRNRRDRLDRQYLTANAPALGVLALLDRAFGET